MNQANVISVNPGVKTLGELNVGNSRIARISRRLAQPVRKPASTLRNFFSLVFGISRSDRGAFSSKMVTLRLMAGAMLTGAAVWHADGFSSLPPVPVLLMLSLGVSLVLGLFTRIVSAASAVGCGYLLYLSVMAGEPDFLAASACLVSLVFAMLGPGRYSADQLMLKVLAAIRRSSRARRARKASGRAFDYKAYHYMDRRVS